VLARKHMLLIFGLLMMECGLFQASGQTGAAPASGASGTPEIQARTQEVVDALSRMGKYLRSLARFEVVADTQTDAVLDSGQVVTFLHRTDLKVARPNRARADITGNRSSKGLVYDGRTFTIFNNAEGYYSTKSAPDTLDGLVRDLSSDYGIETPLADLFYWGNGKVDEVTLTSAVFIGLERIDTRWCRHYAYQQAGVDWELWLQAGAAPLPCRMSIVDTTRDARPRHVVTYHWTVEPVFPTSTFSYRPPANAKAIELKPASRTPFQEGE
jgi:hypothetical protein